MSKKPHNNQRWTKQVCKVPLSWENYSVFNKKYFKTKQVNKRWKVKFSTVFVCNKSVFFSKHLECVNERMNQQKMQLISSWLLCEVFADMCFKNLNLNRNKSIEYREFRSLKVFVNVCGSVRELEVSKAADDLSSYAVRPLKKKFCIFLGRVISLNDPKESKIQKVSENWFFLENL